MNPCSHLETPVCFPASILMQLSSVLKSGCRYLFLFAINFVKNMRWRIVIYFWFSKLVCLYQKQLKVYPNVLDMQLLIKRLWAIQKYMKQKPTIALLMHWINKSARSPEWVVERAFFPEVLLPLSGELGFHSKIKLGWFAVPYFSLAKPSVPCKMWTDAHFETFNEASEPSDMMVQLVNSLSRIQFSQHFSSLLSCM